MRGRLIDCAAVNPPPTVPRRLFLLKGGFDMSNLKSVLVAVVVLSVFMVTPAFPQGMAGCRSGMFIGSYTTLITFPDIWGDGSNLLNQTIFQLNLHSDGTATQEFSG